MANPVMLKVTCGLDMSKATVVWFKGDEQISEPFHYSLLISVSDSSMNFQDLIGKKITVAMNVHTVNEVTLDGSLQTENRYVSGIVGSYTLQHNETNEALCQIEIYSGNWFLQFRRNTKIFHNKSVSDIIKAVCGDNAIMQLCAQNLSITSATEPIEYCVQYDETDFNFLSRLMEHHGVWYFFSHTEDSHSMVITDDKGKFEPSPIINTVRFQHARNEIQFKTVWNRPFVKDEVYFVARRQSSVSKSFSTDDYAFTSATSELYTKVDGSVPPALSGVTFHEYPGKYFTTGDGSKISNLRIAELESESDILEGRSFVRSLTAGYKFTLTEHDSSVFNKEYVVTSLRINIEKETFTNEFVAIPSSVNYRPIRKTQKPKIHGYLSGKVVSPNPDDEIHTDNYGRVLVYFQWNSPANKDDNTTMFIRVGQMWAGKNYGTMFIPRVGMEAIVSFLEGDPDRPIVIGTLYNSDFTIPYAQPDNKETSTMLTRSTPKGSAGNELKFIDKIGDELLYMHAQKNWEALVENDKKTTIKHDDSLEVQNNRTILVKKQEKHTVEDIRNLSVTKDNTEEYKQNMIVSVTEDYKITVKGNLIIDVTGDITMKGMNIKTESKADTEMKAMANFKAEATAMASMKGTASAEVNGTGKTDVTSSGIVSINGSLVKIN